MKKIYETIFGLVFSLMIFLSPAEGEKITNVSNDYHIPDAPKISSLDQVELVPVPPPLILKQANFDNDDMFAGHRSHSSHSSHASHRSHASHSSGSTSPSAPTEEKTPSEKTKSREPSPERQPATPAAKEWQTGRDWLGSPWKLHNREVIIYLKDDSKFQGMVTEWKDNSIQVTRTISGDGEVKYWLDLKDVKTLLWR